MSWLLILLGAAAALLKTRTSLQLGNIALRHQIGVLQQIRQPPTAELIAPCFMGVAFAGVERLAFSVGTRQARQVVAWRRKAFRIFWAWKIRSGKPGRPAVTLEVRNRIRRMSKNNSGWGAPRIHGELLKLGISIGETSVSKYLVRTRRPPSQTWRTFLDNHVKTLVSVEFFTAPTIRFQILYVFLVIAHERRRIVHFAATAHPTAEWTAHQLREHFHGIARHSICCVIATGSSAATLSKKSRPWESHRRCRSPAAITMAASLH